MKSFEQSYDVIFNIDVATIGLKFEASSLTNIDYLSESIYKAPTCKAAENVKNKIEKFLNPASKVKNVKVDMVLDVTPFQRKVLNQLLLIPYGETRSYGGIAKTLNTSARAVGNACRNNPLPIVIPCHRVVAANGIGGYNGAIMGKMLEIKRHLLKLEGII